MANILVALNKTILYCLTAHMKSLQQNTRLRECIRSQDLISSTAIIVTRYAYHLIDIQSRTRSKHIAFHTSANKSIIISLLSNFLFHLFKLPCFFYRDF